MTFITTHTKRWGKTALTVVVAAIVTSAVLVGGAWPGSATTDTPATSARSDIAGIKASAERVFRITLPWLFDSGQLRTRGAMASWE